MYLSNTFAWTNNYQLLSTNHIQFISVASSSCHSPWYPYVPQSYYSTCSTLHQSLFKLSHHHPITLRMTYPSSLIALQMEPPSTNHTPHYVYPSTNHTNLLQLKLPPTSPNKKLTRSMSLQPTTVSITWVIYYPIGLQQGNDNHVRSQLIFYV